MFEGDVSGEYIYRRDGSGMATGGVEGFGSILD